MDMNTVPTDSLRKMFNLAARAHGAGMEKIFNERLHQPSSIISSANCRRSLGKRSAEIPISVNVPPFLSS
jgi:hypothetical protein